MAFKINKAIGTDAGIITGAYVRISGYEIKKNGKVNFALDLFESKDATVLDLAYIPDIHPNKLQSKEVGLSLEVDMTHRVTYTKTITKQVDGVDTEMEEEFTKKVADLSVFESRTIFEVGYEKLGEKLSATFGAENIETV
jgi:methyl coenzyme M reductase subunit C-like uncharacterized protein (methanogenesis marker protein 7)